MSNRDFDTETRESRLLARVATLVARCDEQAAALTAARSRAELLGQGRAEFFTNLGHELRTPLNAIIGLTELLKSEIFGPLGDGRYRDYIKDIAASGHEMLTLIAGLSDLAGIESGNTALEEDAVDVSSLCRSCARTVADTAAASGLKIEVAAPADLPRLRADRGKVERILLNLLSNAVTFNRPGGSVKLAAWSRPDSGYVLQIVDGGLGMALKDIPTALAPLGKLRDRRRWRREKHGLGLPQAKALMELHAGSFDLQSTPGAGTTVTLRFPANRVMALSEVA